MIVFTKDSRRVLVAAHRPTYTETEPTWSSYSSSWYLTEVLWKTKGTSLPSIDLSIKRFRWGLYVSYIIYMIQPKEFYLNPTTIFPPYPENQGLPLHLGSTEVSGGVFWFWFLCQGSNSGRHRDLSLYFTCIKNPGIFPPFFSSSIFLTWWCRFCEEEVLTSRSSSPFEGRVEYQGCYFSHSNSVCWSER